MNLSPNFTLEEFTRSQTAARKGIDNLPADLHIIRAMEELCLNVLEPLREMLNRQIHINSGYRCPKLNEAVGGRPNSQHTKGEAADIIVTGVPVADVMRVIVGSTLPYDEAIIEFSEWVHVSYSDRHRKQALIARLVDGTTQYLPYA